jgi:four helix bundle protein
MEGTNKGHKDLIVYQKAYNLAMEIFVISKQFPKEETYSLTDQIRRSSRSVCVNIAEAYRKRLYPKSFVAKLVDSDGECSETMTWLDFARDCGYMNIETHAELNNKCVEVGKMLGSMINSPEKFIIKNSVESL